VNVTSRSCSLALLLAAGLLASLPGHADSRPERLVVVNSASWVPYSFLDANNEPRGVLVDFWRLFSERTGIDVDFLLVDWQETFERLKDGSADVHGGLTRSDTRAGDFEFSTELIDVQTLVFVARGGDMPLGELSDLQDVPTGVVAGTVEQGFLTQHYPNVPLTAFRNSKDMVAAAVAGEIRAFVADYPTGYYRLIERESTDRFEVMIPLYTDSLHAAVRPDAHGLLSILNDGFASITAAERADIEQRWLVPGAYLPPWVMPTIAATSSGIVLLAFVLHYLALRRVVATRTRELSAALAELSDANAELSRLSLTDPLTGLPNRRRFDAWAVQEVERAQRHKHPVSLALIDLDRFKTINDAYGHPAGDAVLVRASEVMTAALRRNDLLARVGGDEFAALLPATGEDEALRLGARLIVALAGTQVEHDGKVVAAGIQASVGVAVGPQGSLEAWIARADADLYEQKSNRRRTTAESADRHPLGESST
jgi:diguanylate cyclase (GGDEF)-like protein